MGLFLSQIFTCHSDCNFYTYLLAISSDEIVIMAWNVDIIYISVTVTGIITEYYLCYNLFIEFAVMWPYVKTRFKIRLTVYTFVLLLEQDDALYHIHICFIFLY